MSRRFCKQFCCNFLKLKWRIRKVRQVKKKIAIIAFPFGLFVTERGFTGEISVFNLWSGENPLFVITGSERRRSIALGLRFGNFWGKTCFPKKRIVN